MKKKSCITHEFQAYLIDTNNNNNLSPLQWCLENGINYWIVDIFALKWLTIPETSTPSQRVLFIYGLVDTDKRPNLLGVSIRKASILIQQY